MSNDALDRRAFWLFVLGGIARRYPLTRLALHVPIRALVASVKREVDRREGDRFARLGPKDLN